MTRQLTNEDPQAGSLPRSVAPIEALTLPFPECLALFIIEPMPPLSRIVHNSGSSHWAGRRSSLLRTENRTQPRLVFTLCARPRRPSQEGAPTATATGERRRSRPGRSRWAVGAGHGEPDGDDGALPDGTVQWPGHGLPVRSPPPGQVAAGEAAGSLPRKRSIRASASSSSDSAVA
jgi:hypothetical protein